MIISKYKNLIIKILFVLILITALNFIITRQIINERILSDNQNLNRIQLNEQMYSIDRSSQNLTKDFLISDINNIENVIRSEYSSINFDNDAKLSYYKRTFDAYDSRLILVCNAIKKNMTNDSERRSIDVLLYDFKIDRINYAKEYVQSINDAHLKLIEYYKNLSMQTKEKSLEFISKYEVFIDN